MDVDSSKVELETLKQDLALATSGEQQEGEQHYRDIRDIWVRWGRSPLLEINYFIVFLLGSRNW